MNCVVLQAFTATANIQINADIKMSGFDWLVNGVTQTTGCGNFDMSATNPFIFKTHLSLIRSHLF